MVIIYGTRLYGAVNKCAGTSVVTRFFHLYWLPLIPLGSHLLLEEHADGSNRSVTVPLSGPSVLAAYARTWGVAVALMLLVAAVVSAGDEETADAPIMTVIALIAACVAVAGWTVLGRLSTDRRGQQLAYAGLAGYPVDVAMLGDARLSLRASVSDAIARRAPALGAGDYRTQFDPSSQWAQIALDPGVNDTQFLCAALTLARLDWSLSASSQREPLARAHDAIWSKLKAVAPEAIAHARAA